MTTALTGFVCGLKAEADCLSPLATPDKARIAVSGADAFRARAGAAALAIGGIGGLVSFGLSGALMDRLKPGDLILASTVTAPDGAVLEADTTWAQAVTARARAGGLRLQPAPICGSQVIVRTPQDKRRLHADTGAWAVDMESHCVAEIAAARGLPFLALRVIADPADRTIPATAAVGVGEDGRLRPVPVLAALVKRPSDLPGLLKIRKDSQVALDALSRCVHQLGRSLLLPA